MYEIIYSILIQCVGLIAFIFLLISYWKKDKEEIIAYQNIANLFYIIHYALLGAMVGGFVSLAVIIRNIMLFKSKNPKKWMNAFALFFIIEGVIFYDGIESFFPVIAAVNYSFALVKEDKKDIVKAGIISDILWFIYNVLVLSYSGIISETILFISDTLALIKTKKTSKN